MEGGLQVTITHDAFNFTIQDSLYKDPLSLSSRTVGKRAGGFVFKINEKLEYNFLILKVRNAVLTVCFQTGNGTR